MAVLHLVFLLSEYILTVKQLCSGLEVNQDFQKKS